MLTTLKGQVDLIILSVALYPLFSVSICNITKWVKGTSGPDLLI